MVARTRTRVLLGPRVPGNILVTYANGSTQTLGDSTGVQDRKYQSTADITSDHPPPYKTPHFFSSIIRDASFAPEINGERTSGSTKYKYTRYSNINYDGWPDTYDATGIPSMSELAIKAAANMNPNTPDVDLPLFLFELKDLPRMIKYLGDLLARRRPPGGAPGGALAVQFGMLPLLADLKSLLKLAELTAQRQAYLSQLAKGHHVKRKLGKGTGSEVWSVDTWPSITGISVFNRNHSEWEAWYTAEVTCDLTIPQMNDLQLTAFYAVLGLNGPSLSLAWNALPWSWLIDYFSSLGDWLAAHRGYLPFKYKNLCVMRKYEAIRDVTERTNLYGLTFTPGVLTYQHKRREVYQTTPIFGPKMRILSKSQVFNLSALALARDKRVRDLAMHV